MRIIISFFLSVSCLCIQAQTLEVCLDSETFLYGLCNEKGKEVVEKKYSSVFPHGLPHLFVVESEKGNGIYHENSGWLLEPGKYQSIGAPRFFDDHNEKAADTLFWFMTHEGKVGIARPDGIVIDPNYEAIAMPIHHEKKRDEWIPNRYWVMESKSKGWGMIDPYLKGSQYVIGPGLDEPGQYHFPQAVKKNGKYAIVQGYGYPEPEAFHFDTVFKPADPSLQNRRFFAQKDGKWGAISTDNTGNIPCEFTTIKPVYAGWIFLSETQVAFQSRFNRKKHFIYSRPLQPGDADLLMQAAFTNGSSKMTAGWAKLSEENKVFWVPGREGITNDFMEAVNAKNVNHFLNELEDAWGTSYPAEMGIPWYYNSATETTEMALISGDTAALSKWRFTWNNFKHNNRFGGYENYFFEIAYHDKSLVCVQQHYSGGEYRWSSWDLSHYQNYTWRSNQLDSLFLGDIIQANKFEGLQQLINQKVALKVQSDPDLSSVMPATPKDSTQLSIPIDKHLADFGVFQHGLVFNLYIDNHSSGHTRSDTYSILVNYEELKPFLRAKSRIVHLWQ